MIEFYNGFPDAHENAEMEYMIIRQRPQSQVVRDMGNTLFVEREVGVFRGASTITIVDITDQKNKEIELREERRKRESIIQNSTEMIYRVDKKGNFIDLNPAGMVASGLDGRSAPPQYS